MASVSSSASRVWMMIGQIELAREADLQPEDLVLDGPGREVVVVVEPNLADRPRLGNRLDAACGRARRPRLRVR